MYIEGEIPNVVTNGNNGYGNNMFGGDWAW